MEDDDKDRLGDKLRKKEKGEEDRFHAERDRELLEKLRQQRRATDEGHLRAIVHMRCPECAEPMATIDEHGVRVAECPAGHGLWVGHGQIETIARRERDSWLGRYFYRAKR